MRHEGKVPQRTGETERLKGKRGEAPKALRCGEEPAAADDTGRSGASERMERALSPENLKAALARVRKNKGSPGIDGMETEALPGYLEAHGQDTRASCSRGPTSRSQ